MCSGQAVCDGVTGKGPTWCCEVVCWCWHVFFFFIIFHDGIEQGVTFLALGNGAPDVFSAMAAFSHPQTAGLAVGALFGERSALLNMHQISLHKHTYTHTHVSLVCIDFH